MASTYTTFLGLEKPGTGEQSGTWGDTTNTNMDMLDQAVDGIISVTLSATGSTGSPNSLPITDGAVSNGRNKYIEFVDGGDIGATVYVALTPNDAEKVVYLRNSLSGSRSILIFQGTYNTSNDFELLAGKDYVLKFNGGGSGATVTDVNANLAVTALTATTLNGTTVTASGVITGSTVEATGDTAAGDNAAMGFTAAEGLILTGQGSTNDVTIKNDADADVIEIPTGTTTVNFAGAVDVVGDLTAATFTPDGDTAAGDSAAIGFTAAEGLILTGQGSTNDVTIKNDADADVLEIPTGTVNVTVAGDLVAAGTLKATGDTAAGDGAALGFTAAEGLILTGQGSTNDVTIKNDADAAVLQIPTGTVNTTLAGTLGVAGGSTNGVVISQGDIALKNGGTRSTVKFYCESNNAHYAQLQAPAHSAFSGNVTLTLPASTDTLAGIAATQTLTNKTLTTPVLNSPDITGGTAAGDDAALGYTSALGLVLTGQGSSNDVTIKNDADAAVLTVPTGTTNVAVVGDLAVGGSITDSGAAVKVAGLETIYVPAAGMYPETTNGASDLTQVELSNGPELKCLDFAAAADDFAQFQVIFPKSWNEGTVTFQAFFTVTGTNTGTVAWGLAGRSFADSADLNTAFGTQVVATAKAHSGTSNDIDVAAVSGNVTIAGAAADTLTIFQIARDVSADNQSGAARLLGIKLFFTTDAKNDA